MRLWVVHQTRDHIEKADMMSRNSFAEFRRALRADGMPRAAAKPLSTWDATTFAIPSRHERPMYQYYRQTQLSCLLCAIVNAHAAVVITDNTLANAPLARRDGSTSSTGYSNSLLMGTEEDSSALSDLVQVKEYRAGDKCRGKKSAQDREWSDVITVGAVLYVPGKRGAMGHFTALAAIEPTEEQPCTKWRAIDSLTETVTPIHGAQRLKQHVQQLGKNGIVYVLQREEHLGVHPDVPTFRSDEKLLPTAHRQARKRKPVDRWAEDPRSSADVGGSEARQRKLLE
jgi:hypothetical protein